MNEDAFPNKTKPRREVQRSISKNLANLLKNGELPNEFVQVLDLDRIKESEEDFLLTDRRRQLALSWAKLRPLKDAKGIMARTIVGDSALFDAGKAVQEQKRAKTMTKKST